MKTAINLLTSRVWLWQSTLAVASGLLMVLAFPRFSMSYLAWVAIAPLLYLTTREISLKQAFWLGWVTGVVFTFLAESWIAHSMTRYGGLWTTVAYAVAFLFASLLAVFPAIFAVVVTLISRRFRILGLVAAPIVWIATEWLRPVVTGVTWNALGISQVGNYSVARLAQFGGVYLVSWELVTAGAILALVFRSREQLARRAAAGMLLLLVLPILLLPLPARMRKSDDASVRTLDAGTPFTVVGVQPNIDITNLQGPDDFYRNFESVAGLTKDGLGRLPNRKADLIVWAESPFALMYENDPSVRERVDALAKETGAYVLANTVTREGDIYFNSVHIIDPGRREGSAGRSFKRYDKVRLVPFGEYVPWRPFLGRFVPAIVGDFTAGSEAVVNTLKFEEQREGVGVSPGNESPQFQIERTTRFVRVGAFICYEAAYPALVRRFVDRGATVLINVSDDAWFGDTAGAEQHLAHAVMRAIENDRDLVRVTNTGISALITARGDVVNALPKSTPAAQVWEVSARGGKTFYTRNGDAFAIGCAVIAAIVLLGSIANQSWLRNWSQSRR